MKTMDEDEHEGEEHDEHEGERIFAMTESISSLCRVH